MVPGGSWCILVDLGASRMDLGVGLGGSWWTGSWLDLRWILGGF